METTTETTAQQQARHMREEAARIDRKADKIDALMIRTRETLNKELAQAQDPAYSGHVKYIIARAAQLAEDIDTLNEARVAISNAAYKLRQEAARKEEEDKYKKK